MLMKCLFRAYPSLVQSLFMGVNAGTVTTTQHDFEFALVEVGKAELYRTSGCPPYRAAAQ